MISYEEYDETINNEGEEDVKLPTTLIVITIVLLSIVGIYIVCQAIWGL